MRLTAEHLLLVILIPLLSAGCGPGTVDVAPEEGAGVEAALAAPVWPTWTETDPVYVDDFLAMKAYAGHPDGDTPGIQAAIEECVTRAGADTGKHCTVHFTAGKTYHMSRTRAGGHGLVIAGKRVTLQGHGATIVNATTTNHHHGDTLDITGLRYGLAYPRYAGKTEGNKHWTAPELTEYVEVVDLNLEHDPVVAAMPELANRNCIGIVHASGVRLTRVKCHNAHQTSFGAVSVLDPDESGELTFHTQVVDLILDDVHAIDSQAHAFRFSLQGGATDMQATMRHCSSRNVGVEALAASTKEVGARGIHVWYRAGVAASNPNASLTMEDCGFDSSGEVVVTQGVGASLIMRRNRIYGGLNACLTPRNGTTVTLEDNSFACTRSIDVPDKSLTSALDVCIRKSLEKAALGTKTSVFLRGIIGGTEQGSKWLTRGKTRDQCMTELVNPFVHL